MIVLKRALWAIVTVLSNSFAAIQSPALNREGNIATPADRDKTSPKSTDDAGAPK